MKYLVSITFIMLFGCSSITNQSEFDSYKQQLETLQKQVDSLSFIVRKNEIFARAQKMYNDSAGTKTVKYQILKGLSASNSWLKSNSEVLHCAVDTTSYTLSIMFTDRSQDKIDASNAAFAAMNDSIWKKLRNEVALEADDYMHKTVTMVRKSDGYIVAKPLPEFVRGRAQFFEWAKTHESPIIKGPWLDSTTGYFGISLINNERLTCFGSFTVVTDGAL